MLPSAGNIIFSICGLVGGFYVMTHAYYINHHIYFLSFAEKKFGTGGGTLAYRVIGISLMIFSLFVLTGWVDLFSTGTQSTQTIPNGTTQSIPRTNTGIQIAP